MGFNSFDRSSVHRGDSHAVSRTSDEINKDDFICSINRAFDEQCWMASAAFGAACRLGRGASDADISLRSGLNAQ